MSTSFFRENTIPYTCKVSSVLNKDSQTYGKKFLFDGADDTCWNSDEGSTQWIIINFEQKIDLTKIKLQFQGGFASSHCTLLTDTGDGRLLVVQQLYPADSNKEQIFALDKVISGDIFKLALQQPTDTYGRITLYHLDFLGS